MVDEKIHEVLRQAYHYGASIIALENPEVVGYLRYYWVRGGDRRHENYKLSMFRSFVIERIEWKALLHGMKVVYVDPKGTSSSAKHELAMKKLKLGRHTASAYIIAGRALKN